MDWGGGIVYDSSTVDGDWKGMNDMVNEILGSNIRQNRLNLNWTQEKMAEKLCVSHQVISKWENGIAAPDITALCAMAGIFGISLDALCGVDENQTESLIEEMERMTARLENTYEVLYAKWKEMENRVLLNPADDRLLYNALCFLRVAHDRVVSDGQKEQINEEIRRISQRLLDFSRNDSYRSYANYNLAVYYDEQVNTLRGDAQDAENARRSKKYADLVLYKDMMKTFYHSFGTVTLEEKCLADKETLCEMVRTAIGACKNLMRLQKHFPETCENTNCEEIMNMLNKATAYL